MKKLLSFALIAAVLSIGAATTAFADETPSFGFYTHNVDAEGHSTYYAVPGTSTLGRSTVSNFDKERIIETVISFEPGEVGDYKQIPPEWILVEGPNQTLKPGASEDINFQINIPKNAEFGEYKGTLVAMMQNYKPNVEEPEEIVEIGTATANVKVKFAVGSTIYINVVNALPDKSTTEAKATEKTEGSKVAAWIGENLNAILIVIIVLILVNMAIRKSRKK